MNHTLHAGWLTTSLSVLAVVACSAGGDDNGLNTPSGGSAGSSGGAGSGGTAGSGGFIDPGSGGTGAGAGGGFVNDPTTCEEAAANNSYIGCDYWPTVTANNVWSIFDFAVVVSNTGQEVADVHVTGNGVDQNHQVQPGQLVTIYLPWVPALKGADADNCGSAVPISQTVLAAGGAFHLVSSRPVTVYQFNALEYKGEGGPPGKNWGACPGNQVCASAMSAVGCFSFSNDASLLLPSTAMTGNYRLAGYTAWDNSGQPFMPTYAAVTATQPNTQVEIRANGRIMAGGGVPAMNAGETATVTLQQGDVLQLVGGNGVGDDLSGTLIFASNAVQVITGMPCRNIPSDKFACDHIEESVFPAETLGKEYVVTVPAAPHGQGAPAVGHAVRIVGNVDGTTLHFDPPINAPGVTNGQATVNAGQVLDLGQQNGDFKVWSDQSEFIVATFMLGAEIIDPSPNPFTPYESKGDPSQSLLAAIEQFRSLYVFLAPQDYDVNFVNIVGPSDAGVNLDGVDIPPEWYVPIGGTGLGVVRFQLAPTGTHRLQSAKPVGIQVYGYGSYTTYQYPGGLNLKAIAPPPPK